MLGSSNSLAAFAVAATVLAASAAENPSPAHGSAPLTLYSLGSDVAVPHGGVLLLHAAPGSERVLARVGARTVFGSPMRLAVVGTSGEWLAVISAALGNRIRGFVHRSKVSLVHDPFSLEVDLSSRSVRVWRMGEVLRRFGVAVGTPATPTPRGRFAITDKLSNFWPSYYGCCAMALSGRQTRPTLRLDRRRSTGDPRRQRHRGAVSNGCLRAADNDMHYLMTMLPLGTQVVVHD